MNSDVAPSSSTVSPSTVPPSTVPSSTVPSPTVPSPTVSSSPSSPTQSELTPFLRAFHSLAEAAARVSAQDETSLVDALATHLGVRPEGIAVVAKEVVPHRFADYDVALEHLASPDGATLGLGGGDARHHQSLADMVSNPWARIAVGQVDWNNLPINATQTRRVMALGIRLFAYEGQQVAVLQRRTSRMHGNGTGVIEVMCPDADAANRLLDELTGLATQLSVLRGNVVSLELVGYEAEGDGYRLVARPEVPAESVILPDGVLDRISRHVVGIARHAETLRQRGQHLKRGVLLYGPPGTGKTHTVRHLIGATPEHTVVLLSGRTLGLIGAATAIARHLQPSIVVLEDCDLVAMDRGLGDSPQPLLFEVLDALDGLDSDADVAFLLTTNRAEVLEEALAQRPGRVDLGVEIPLPDEPGRRRLLTLYARDLDFSSATLDAVAARTDARTASFFKELIRRAVLDAADAGSDPGDEHLLTALEELTDDQDRLARSLFGADPGAVLLES